MARRISRFVWVIPLLVATTLGPGSPWTSAAVPTPTLVAADDETTATSHSGDSADDPAIWVHPTDPAASLIIGSDKKGALEVYSLSGDLRQRITTATTFWGNVDVRQGVSVGGRTLDVVAAYNGGGVRLYSVDPDSGLLMELAEAPGALPTGGGEGLCLYQSAANHDLFAFVITRAGRVSQYRLADADGDGDLEASLARRFLVGSEAEGCVADDDNDAFYVSEEDVGLWRYGAEPSAGTSRTMVDSVQPAGNLAADVEGLTLVELPSGGGYLIASAQNVVMGKQSYFVRYDRLTNAYAGSFRVVAGTGADGCQRTDGIAAYAGDLGPSYPQGLFVCQDHTNTSPGTGATQDFKLVQLQKVVDLGPEAPPPTN